MKKIFLIVLLAQAFPAAAQFNPPWRGKKCAVVITYDDAINQHLDHAIPVLDSLGLKATFYITAFSASVQARINEWKKIAVNGHELGNHTLYHPCIGNTPGREWVPARYDLATYTVPRIVDEIKMTSLFLQSLDGKTARTYAYTCADTTAGGVSYTKEIKDEFIAMRNVRNEMHRIQDVNTDDLDCYMVNHHTAEQMIDWVKKAMESNSLLVILFHGVGGGNGLDVSLAAHRELLTFIKQNEKDIYVAPMAEVAQHIREWQARDKQIKAQQKATQEDHRQMMKQLGLTNLRPGPSGNPAAHNAANTDESKVKQVLALPDPLVLKNGKKVADAKTWWNKRRPEIIEAFDREIYGRVPAKTPCVKWEVTGTIDTSFGNVKAVTKTLLGHVDNSSYPSISVDIQLSLTLPANRKGPVPVMIEFGFIIPPGFRLPQTTGASPQKSWQEQVLEKGWGFAILVPTSYQADNGAGLTAGIIGLCNKGQYRKPEDWGALRAWAWGTSRVIDYFETDKDVDAKRIGIEGLSRYGKAAVVTMAYEPRIAIGFIGSSGAGGTKILRRIFGEQVENLASSAEYHWFAGNFIKYAADPLNQDDLPVDAHQLVALCAPRPVFISSGSPTVEGQWVDAKGMFLGAVYAGPVYTLLGKKDLGTAELPPLETALTDGDIAWRQHSGGHTTGPNWSFFLAFAERYFNP